MTKRYGIFDENGIPKGFYSDDAGATPPQDAIEISEDDWKYLLGNQGHSKWDGTKPISYVREESYLDKRVVEYPDLADQLDALMKWVSSSDSVDASSDLKKIAKKCMDIKDKYPK